MKCDACGIESDFEAGFIKVHRSLNRADLMLCPRCWSRRHRTSTAWYQIIIFIWGIIGCILVWQNDWPNLGQVLKTIFLLNLFLILAIVPHELGHAIVGRLLGWRVFFIGIGIGKRFLKFRLFGTLIGFHQLPIAGFTCVIPVNAQLLRTKRFLMVLAGIPQLIWL